jgi:hypothetical protein
MNESLRFDSERISIQVTKGQMCLVEPWLPAGHRQKYVDLGLEVMMKLDVFLVCHLNFQECLISTL